MFGFTWFKLGIYGAMLAALLGGYAYEHHRIYAQGEAAQLAIDAPILAADKTLIDVYANAILASNAQVTANQAKAAEQKTQADAAVKVAQASAQDADKTLAAWMVRYSAALRTPDCASWAAQPICPALGADL